MKDLRKIVENWHAKLSGATTFDSRKAESRWTPDFISQMCSTFAVPDRTSIAAAFRTLIKIQTEQRRIIAAQQKVEWKTSEAAIQKISAMITQLEAK